VRSPRGAFPREAAIAEHVTSSPQETERLGEELGRGMHGGEVVLLEGELGAGKTAFVRGLARGLGADPDEVASPTFVLLTAYPGRLTLHHADLYRLSSGGDDRELGLEELPGPNGVLAVEWPERLGERRFARVVRVYLEHAGEDLRRVRVEEGAA
jgi:tRNA threonylcarbamoyladenosine biosynthesis protein TsaE